MTAPQAGAGGQQLEKLDQGSGMETGVLLGVV